MLNLKREKKNHKTITNIFNVEKKSIFRHKTIKRLRNLISVLRKFSFCCFRRFWRVVLENKKLRFPKKEPKQKSHKTIKKFQIFRHKKKYDESNVKGERKLERNFLIRNN
jgi:cAMP phosphodiesterase